MQTCDNSDATAALSVFPLEPTFHNLCSMGFPLYFPFIFDNYSYLFNFDAMAS